MYDKGIYFFASQPSGGRELFSYRIYKRFLVLRICTVIYIKSKK